MIRSGDFNTIFIDIFVIDLKWGVLAQLVAHDTGSVGVRGSNPLHSTIFKIST